MATAAPAIASAVFTFARFRSNTRKRFFADLLAVDGQPDQIFLERTCQILSPSKNRSLVAIAVLLIDPSF
jgi:hypothetical protein